MYFQLVYTEKRLWHARLCDSNDAILFWTKESASKQTVVNLCDAVRRGMRTDTPIYNPR